MKKKIIIIIKELWLKKIKYILGKLINVLCVINCMLKKILE